MINKNNKLKLIVKIKLNKERRWQNVS